MWTSPFQCESCWVVNLLKREIKHEEPKDVVLMQYLRRMNLDVMWSRESSTVRDTLAQLTKGARMSAELGLEPINIPRGPWPTDDLYGCQVALEMLKASQLKGRNDQRYQQFETIRKLRSGFTNAMETSSAGANLRNFSFKAAKKSYAFQSTATDSILFQRFMTGLLSRMGRLVLQQLGIDNRQLHKLLEYLDKVVRDNMSTWEERVTV